MSLSSRHSLRLLLVTILAFSWGCGARGIPLPPLRPQPAPIFAIEAEQHGAMAIIRFATPLDTLVVEGRVIAVTGVELLVYTERYAALTANFLSGALQRERRRRLDEAEVAALEEQALADARVRAAEEEAREAARAEAEAASEIMIPLLDKATAEEPPPVEEELSTLTVEELLLRNVPASTLQDWHTGGVRPDILLEGAYRLDQALDAMWALLDLPTAFFDFRRRPNLPDPDLVLEAAEQVARAARYDRVINQVEFLDRAVIAASIPLEKFEDYIAEENWIAVEFPVGIPSDTDIRTRYFFAARTISESGGEGDVGGIAVVVPEPVPVPPTALEIKTVLTGLSLTWKPPAGDVWGRITDPDMLTYDVYRSPTGESLPSSPVNTDPLTLPNFVDTTIDWGEIYDYEVRASHTLRASIQDETGAEIVIAGVAPQETLLSLPQSAGTRLESYHAVDSFPPSPALGLEGGWVGGQVTLRWQPPLESDANRYRVYRHQVPAPELPEPIVSSEPESSGEADASDAVTRSDGTEREGEQSGASVTPAGQQEDEERDPDSIAETSSVDSTEGKVADTSESQGDAVGRIRNPLLVDGWRLLTRPALTRTQYVDTPPDDKVGYVYLVEVLDSSGNTSPAIEVEVTPRSGS